MSHSDISTEKALKKFIRDETVAGLLAGMITITHQQQRIIGILQGIIAAGIFILTGVCWFAYTNLDMRIAVNEIDIRNILGASNESSL